jgi:hypothetical protein
MTFSLAAAGAAGAFAAAALRQRIIDGDDATQLVRVMTAAGVREPADIRAWLAAGGVDQRLRSSLEPLLPAVGAAFGPYTAVAHLADGAMGRIWLCVTADRGVVVVKTLKTDVDQSEALVRARRRLEREIEVLAGFRHPRIVSLIGSGSTGGLPWLAMEFMPDGDLATRLGERDRLQEAEALAIAAQVAEALVAVQAAGCVHRDLKPANIFLSGATAKLADFGSIRRVSSDPSSITLPGTVHGSPAYLSPEQAQARPLDIRSDFYALGCVVWHMLTGRQPFVGTVKQIMRAHISEAPPALPDGLFSPETEQLISRCLAKDPGGRHQDAAELQAAIAEARSAALARAPQQHGTARIVRASIGSRAAPAPRSAPGAALAGAWLALRGSGDLAVHIHAGAELVIGKLAATPVHLPALLYPIARHSAASNRVSRLHAAIRITPGGVEVADLGSRNGTRLDDRPLEPHTPVTLPDDRPVRLSLATLLELDIEVVRSEDRSVIDAVLVRRPLNRPGLAYALANGPVRVGSGPGALPWPDAEEAVEFAQVEGCWCSRSLGRTTWSPLCEGQAVELGEATAVAVCGAYEQLT